MSAMNEELIEEYVRDHGKCLSFLGQLPPFLQSWAMISGMQREDFSGG